MSVSIKDRENLFTKKRPLGRFLNIIPYFSHFFIHHM